MALMDAADYAKSSEYKAKEAAAKAYRDSQSSSIGVPIPRASSGPSRVENQGLADPQMVRGNSGSNVPMPQTVNAPPTARSGVSYPGNVPMPQIQPMQPVAPVRDMATIRKYAEEQVARKIADAQRAAGQNISALDNTANAARTGIQTSYDRLRSQTTDQRNLQNFELSQKINPFSGRGEYQKTQIDREREISDRQSSENFTNSVGSIESDLATRKAAINENLLALQNAAPQEREALEEKLVQSERDYEMALKNQDRNDILANAQLYQQDWTRQQAESAARAQSEQAAYEATINAQKVEEARKQNNIDNAIKLSQVYGRAVLPKENGEELFKQVLGLDTVEAQKLAQDVERYGAEMAIKEALAQNTISESQAQMALNKVKVAIDQQQVDIQQQNASTSAANASANNQLGKDKLAWEKDPTNPANMPKPEKELSQSDKNAFVSQMRQLYTKNDDSGSLVVTNPDALKSAIISQYYPNDALIDQTLITFGLQPNK